MKFTTLAVVAASALGANALYNETTTTTWYPTGTGHPRPPPYTPSGSGYPHIGKNTTTATYPGGSSTTATHPGGSIITGSITTIITLPGGSVTTKTLPGDSLATKTPVGPSTTSTGSPEFTGAASANLAAPFSGLAAVGLAVAYLL